MRKDDALNVEEIVGADRCCEIGSVIKTISRNKEVELRKKVSWRRRYLAPVGRAVDVQDGREVR